MRLPLMPTLTLVVAFFVAVSILAMWIPSSKVASEALFTAREDQLLAGTLQVDGRIHEFWRSIFQFAETWAQAWNTTVTTNPDEPAGAFFNKNMHTMWNAVALHPFIRSMLFTYLEDPAYIARQRPSSRGCVSRGVAVQDNLVQSCTRYNSGNNRSCNSPEVLANPWLGCHNTTLYTYITGRRNFANPMAPVRKVSIPCGASVVSGTLLYRIRYLKGNLTNLDSGVRAPRFGGWTQDPRGPPNKDARIALLLLFPLAAPRWGPLSGYGFITVTASSSGQPSPPGSISIGDMLQQAADSSDIDETLSLLLDDGNLIATSLPALSCDKRALPEAGEEVGKLLGLLRADNASAGLPRSIHEVAHHLINSTCTVRSATRARDRTGRNAFFEDGFWKVDCTWRNVPRIQRISGYTVASKDMEFGGIRMLLVAVIETSVVTEDADALNEVLTIVAVVVFVVFSALALVFARSIAAPVSRFASEMETVACMAVEEIGDTSPKSMLAEVWRMETAMILMVGNMKVFKSFMPQAVLVTMQESEEESDESQVARGSTGDSARMSMISTPSRSSVTMAANPNNNAAHKLMGGTASRCVSLATVNLVGWSASDYSTTMHEDYVLMVTERASRHRGIPEAFFGDSITVSFNASKLVGSHAELVLSFLSGIRGASSSATTAAATCGNCKIGVIGIPSMMRFSFLGRAMGHILVLERFCAAMGCVNVVTEALLDRCPAAKIIRLGQFRYPKSKDRSSLISEVRKVQVSKSNEEWMYELNQMSTDADEYSEWNTLVSAICDGDFSLPLTSTAPIPSKILEHIADAHARKVYCPFEQSYISAKGRAEGQDAAQIPS